MGGMGDRWEGWGGEGKWRGGTIGQEEQAGGAERAGGTADREKQPLCRRAERRVGRQGQGGRAGGREAEAGVWLSPTLSTILTT